MLCGLGPKKGRAAVSPGMESAGSATGHHQQHPTGAGDSPMINARPVQPPFPQQGPRSFKLVADGRKSSGNGLAKSSHGHQ